MPKLSKGRILHYIHSANDPLPGAVDPAIVRRAYPDGSVVLAVLADCGVVSVEGATVAEGPEQAERGQAFWPDYSAEADLEFVALMEAAEQLDEPKGSEEQPKEKPTEQPKEVEQPAEVTAPATEQPNVPEPAGEIPEGAVVAPPQPVEAERIVPPPASEL